MQACGSGRVPSHEISGGSMEFTTIESAVTPTVRERVEHTRQSHEDRERPKLTRWGVLYGILAASVGLCVGGSRLAAVIGHPVLVQYGVALAILGLLVAWVRGNRAALSPATPGTHPRIRHPFSIVHVAFSPRAADPDPRAFGAPRDGADRGVGVRPTATAPHR